MLTQVKWPTQMEDTSAHVASLEGSFPELSECLFSICGSQVQVQLNACSPLNRLQQVAIRLVLKIAEGCYYKKEKELYQAFLDIFSVI